MFTSKLQDLDDHALAHTLISARFFSNFRVTSVIFQAYMKSSTFVGCWFLVDWFEHWARLFVFLVAQILSSNYVIGDLRLFWWDSQLGFEENNFENNNL